MYISIIYVYIHKGRYSPLVFPIGIPVGKYDLDRHVNSGKTDLPDLSSDTLIT